MFSDFIEDFGGWIIGLVLVGLIVGIVWAAADDVKQKKAACAHAWQVAKTSADSIAVVLRCEVGESEKTNTVVIPMYVPR